MDEINQVPVPQTPATPTPSLPLPEITPPNRKNVKIWVGIIVAILVVSVGAFLMFGKTSTYRGSFKQFGPGQKVELELQPKVDLQETPKAEQELQPFETEEEKAAKKAAEAAEAEKAAESKAKELLDAVKAKFKDAERDLKDSQNLFAKINTANLPEADDIYKKLEINDAAIFNAKEKIGEFRAQIDALFEQYKQNQNITGALNQATDLYNKALEFVNQSAEILKNAKAKIDAAKSKKTLGGISDSLAGLGGMQDQIKSGLEDLKEGSEAALAMVDELNKHIADAEKAAANAQKYAEEAAAAADSVKDLQNSTYPEVAEKAKAANAAAAKAIGAKILADGAVGKAKKAKTLEEAQAAKTDAEKAETDALAAMEDAKTFAQQAKDLLAAAEANQNQNQPVLSISISPAGQQTVGQPVTFTLTASDMPEPPPYKFKLAFGDNNIQNGDSPTNTYTKKYTYQTAHTNLVVQAQVFNKTDKLLAYGESFYTIVAADGGGNGGAPPGGDIKCEAGFLYDTNTKTCVPPSNITCASGLLYDPNSKACVPQNQIIQNVMGGGGGGSGGGSTNVTVNIPPMMSPSAPDVKCSDPKFTYDAVAKVCVPPTQVAIADKDDKKDTKKTKKKSTKSAADDKKEETVIAADIGSQPKTIDAAPKPAATGSAYGATIQGKTGPGVLLYPIIIAGANGLYYLARKRRGLK